MLLAWRFDRLFWLVAKQVSSLYLLEVEELKFGYTLWKESVSSQIKSVSYMINCVNCFVIFKVLMNWWKLINLLASHFPVVHNILKMLLGKWMKMGYNFFGTNSLMELIFILYSFFWHEFRSVWIGFIF